MVDTCSVQRCDRAPFNARGWCQTHYKRWLKHGDVLADKPVRPIRPPGMSLRETFGHWMPGDPPAEGIVWPWSGSLDKHGYGYFRFGGRIVWAHRVAYELFREPIPTGLVIRHTNDVPHDVNPWNMEVGTQTDNLADMVARDRQSRGPSHGEKTRGERNTAARLTNEDVLAIRADYASGRWTLAALGNRHAVTEQAIWLIVHRKNWKHI